MSGCFGKYDFPLLFGIVEQAIKVYVVHQGYPDHGNQSGEAPRFESFLQYHEQQVCYERHPDLYLDGVCTFAVEVFQWNVLFHLLELPVVDIRAVHGHDVTLTEVRRFEHERIVCSRRGELYVGWHAFVGLDDRMHLDASLLSPCLWMASYSLEKQVGEQSDGRGVYDLKTFHPFRGLVAAAVR